MTAENQNCPVRMLLGSVGQPCGLLDVGSAASGSGLADVRIVPVFAARIFDIEPDLYRRIALACPGEADVRFVLDVLGERFTIQLLDWRPHVVGFRIEAGQLDLVQAMARAVRMLCDTEIIIGGPSATSHAEQLLDLLDVDYIFTGEADESIVAFLRYAVGRNTRDCQVDVPGLAYRWAGQTYVNRASMPETFDPNIAIDRSDLHITASQTSIASNRLDWSLLSGFDIPLDGLYFTGGRGCPGQCTFCSRLHGTRLRVKSAEQLMREIRDADRLVRNGHLHVERYTLFEHVDDPGFTDSQRNQDVAWCSIFDEDFFIDRRRAIRFFELWSESPELNARYRINVQANPCSLLLHGCIDTELLDWIDRLKPMVMIGGESFHSGILRRWRKRHTVQQLETVLDALERTRQDYTVFQLLTDYESEPDELTDAVWLLVKAALARPRMRVASSPMTIPLYDTDIRRGLESQTGGIMYSSVQSYTDYETVQPDWMNPTTLALADLADEHLQEALHPQGRTHALINAMRAIAHHAKELADALPEDAKLQELKEQTAWQFRDLDGK